MRIRRSRKKIRRNFNHTKYVPRTKFGKVTWVFNSQDDDYWPSIPHGHSIDYKEPLKMDTFTGDIYNKNTKQKVGRVKEKELRMLLRDRKFRDMEQKANLYYEDKFPDIYKRLGYPKPRSNDRISYVASRSLLVKNIHGANKNDSLLIAVLSIEPDSKMHG